MASDRIDVRHVARLARLALTDEEAATYGAQLDAILGHVDALQGLPTGDVAATAQVVPLRNVTRDDRIGPCLPRDVVLAEAPQTDGRFFRVPRIISEEA
jgi:aspartyl-tRNA(Asn)/glutamyl-tRNA(Gln) amidotransferase subunit C